MLNLLTETDCAKSHINANPEDFNPDSSVLGEMTVSLLVLDRYGILVVDVTWAKKIGDDRRDEKPIDNTDYIRNPLFQQKLSTT